MSLDDRSKSDTAFVCHKGLFCFSAMPFGFTNAPVRAPVVSAKDLGRINLLELFCLCK